MTTSQHAHFFLSEVTFVRETSPMPPSESTDARAEMAHDGEADEGPASPFPSRARHSLFIEESEVDEFSDG